MKYSYKTALFFFCVNVFLIAFSVSSYAELKIGYIRPRYIFENYTPYKEAAKLVQEYEKSEMDKIQAEKQKFDKNVEEAEKKALLMSEEIVAQTRQELAKQQQALEKEYNEIYKDDGRLRKKQEELIEPVIGTINKVIMRVGKDEGYDYLLDAEQGGVLYANDKYDISDHILEELKKGTPTQ